MRHLIAVFFLCILSSQILPLKQVGKILFKSQITEEIGHDAYESDGDDVLDALKLFTTQPFTGNDGLKRIDLLTSVITGYIHTSESIPDLHESEIFVPPPNSRVPLS